MPDRRLVLKELWNEFCARDPYVSRRADLNELAPLFHAGAIAMFLFMAETDPGDGVIEDLMQEIRDYCIAQQIMPGMAYDA